MTTLEDILKTFTDTELAYLYKYQFDTYLVDTQTKIKNFIFDKRGLTKATIDNLIAKNADKVVDKIGHCPRCKTDKLRTDKIDWAIPLFKAGVEDEYASLHELKTGQPYLKDKITCNVCGYVLVDPNSDRRPFYKKILDFFFDNPAWTVFRKE